jgi:hypothetical protein
MGVFIERYQPRSAGDFPPQDYRGSNIRTSESTYCADPPPPASKGLPGLIVGTVEGSNGGNGDDGGWRKAVAKMYRSASTSVASPGRVASWLRKDYPKGAPERGHNYLVALCGLDDAAR